MERLTTNKNVPNMSMIELAYNSCYVDDEHNARYMDYRKMMTGITGVLEEQSKS